MQLTIKVDSNPAKFDPREHARCMIARMTPAARHAFLDGNGSFRDGVNVSFSRKAGTIIASVSER